jgi:hypothetical protein
MRVFRTDAASKPEFCKSRHGEAIIYHCSLLQSARPSLSTSTRLMDRKRCRMRFIPRVIKESRAISTKMPKPLAATASILLFCCTAALAESSSPPRQQTVKSSHNLPKALVGQRQPTPRDSSAAKGNDDNGLLGDDAVDKALDSKIKSICRGCF